MLIWFQKLNIRQQFLYFTLFKNLYIIFYLLYTLFSIQHFFDNPVLSRVLRLNIFIILHLSGFFFFIFIITNFPLILKNFFFYKLFSGAYCILLIFIHFFKLYSIFFSLWVKIIPPPIIVTFKYKFLTLIVTPIVGE